MPTNNPRFSSRKKQLSDYARYSAMGFQMAVVIFLCTWAGTKLDDLLGFKVPVFTLVFSLSSVVLVMWYFVRSFLKKK